MEFHKRKMNSTKENRPLGEADHATEKLNKTTVTKWLKQKKFLK